MTLPTKPLLPSPGACAADSSTHFKYHDYYYYDSDPLTVTFDYLKPLCDYHVSYYAKCGNYYVGYEENSTRSVETVFKTAGEFNEYIYELSNLKNLKKRLVILTPIETILGFIRKL